MYFRPTIPQTLIVIALLNLGLVSPVFAQGIIIESDDYDGHGYSGDSSRSVDETHEPVRYAGDKTFYLGPDGYYIDSVYSKRDFDLIDIEYLGDEFYEMIARDPYIVGYFSVSSKIIVVLGNTAYRISPPDHEVDPDAWRPVTHEEDDPPMVEEDEKPPVTDTHQVSKSKPNSNVLGYTLAIILIILAAFMAFKLANK